MRKDKLYFLTFLSVTLIYLLVAVLATSYLLKDTTLELIESQLESGKKETRTFAILAGYKLQNSVSRDSVSSQIQEGLYNTNQNNIFLSIIDWSGRIVSHPEIRKVGQLIRDEKSYVTSVADNINAREFYALLKKENLNDSIAHSSAIVYMYPIQNSDWVVASHINLKNLDAQINRLKARIYTIFGIVGLLIIPLFVLTTRYISSTYEKRLELQKQKLEDEVISLSKLNRAVGDYKQKVIENTGTGTTKKRILTYLRNELLSIPLEEIAHIYTENTITYVVCFDGKKSTTNSSLDEIFSQLDESAFFRANRQFIIAISSINKIVKYGNNQLKILVHPETQADILISKNKAAEFKNWLDL